MAITGVAQTVTSLLIGAAKAGIHGNEMIVGRQRPLKIALIAIGHSQRIERVLVLWISV